MKKILSLLLSATLLIASVYISIPAVADSVLSAEDVAEQLGGNEENLVWSEDFSTAAITEKIKVEPTYEANKQVYEVKDGKWLIGAQGGKDLTLNGGWTDISLDDFIVSFEFSTKQGWGQSNFYYHSTTGWPDNYDYRLNIFGGAGYKATLTLEKKGDANVRDSVSGFDLPLNTEFNVVIISKGNTDSVYMWKKGEEAPVVPTLSITTEDNATGDIYYYTYQDSIALDNVNVYELSEMNTAAMEIATGLELVGAKSYYSNNFNNALQAPVTNFDAYAGTNEIVNNKWQISGEVGTSTGLTGQSIHNFAMGFQFAVNDATDGFYADFAYHSSTGWANLNNENRLNVFEQNGKLTFVLNGKAGVSQYAATEYVQGDLINVVLTYIDKQVSAYIWKCVEEIPQTPTITITATEETSGDFFFHLANATFIMDNFFVYDTADTRLYPEHILKATGLIISEENLIYKNDFNTADKAPVENFTAYVGKSEIKERKWQTSGEIGTSTGLTGQSLQNFAMGFQFAVNDATNGFYADFAYHSSTGWANLNNENRLNMFEQNGKLTFVLNGKAGVSQYAATEYVQGDLINVVLTYIDKQVSAYIWKCGEEIPTTPTIIITATEETSGDIYFHLANATFTMDNFYVYNAVKNIPEEPEKPEKPEEIIDVNPLLPEHIAKATGLDTSANYLIYKNNLNEITEPPVKSFNDYIGTSEIKSGKWQTSGEIGTSTGLINETLQDFAMGFQFAVNDATDGFYADFAYHSSTGWANLNNENRLNVFEQNGKLTFVLNGKAGVSQYAVTEYKQGDLINVVLTYIENQVSAYIWKYGEEIPQIPLLTVKTTEETSGDIYFHLANATFTMDNFYVYNPVYDTSDDFDNNSLTPEDIEKVTGIDFADTDLVYKSRFVNTKITPAEIFDAYNGTSAILNNKWVTNGEIGTSTGLTGTTLKNFTLGFQFTVSNIKENAYADFAYHSSTGWANLNNENRLNMFIKDGKLVFALSAKEGQSRNVVTDYKADDLLNVVLTYSDKVIMLYLWEFGDKLPTEPILSVRGTTETQGDIYFHLSHATFVMDDFYVYNNPINENQSPAQKDKVLINKNFDVNGDLLFKADKTGITSTKNGQFEFNTDGHKMLYSPLLAEGEIAEDFSWQFTYIPSETTWNTDRFKFHCQGDRDSDSVYLQILGSGNAKDGKNLQLVRVLNNKAYVLASAEVDIHRLNAYTVRIISENNNISVYWWKVGTSTPNKPILSADNKDVILEKGGFMVEGFHTVFYIDDMKLYNYASGKQLTTHLPKLPDEIMLAYWNFNNLRGKSDFPFEAKDSLKYWQNTLKIETPMKPERKQVTTTNLVGDYELSDLSWEFDVREFESWAVDKFIIHSLDGTSSNSIYLLFTGNAAKVLQDGFNGKDPSNSALRLIQVIDGKVTVLGTCDEEIARGKGYSIKITSRDNNIEVWFGAKRTGKIEKVISAKADERLSSGQLLIESFNSEMWLDNIKISNSADGSDKAYEKSLYAVVK